MSSPPWLGTPLAPQSSGGRGIPGHRGGAAAGGAPAGQEPRAGGAVRRLAGRDGVRGVRGRVVGGVGADGWARIGFKVN